MMHWATHYGTIVTHRYCIGLLDLAFKNFTKFSTWNSDMLDIALENRRKASISRQDTGICPQIFFQVLGMGAVTR